MTNEEIIEGNKKIAEFMGWKKVTSYNGEVWDMSNVDKSQESLFGELVDKNNGKYHSSWDWIMPVVEKIESKGYFCMINKWTSVYTGTDGERIEVTTVQGNTKILNTWKAVLEFITWYNSM